MHSNSAPNQEIHTTSIAPGEPCIDGGIELTLGTDADDDGALTGGEIDSIELRCNGEPSQAAGILMRREDVVPTSAHTAETA